MLLNICKQSIIVRPLLLYRTPTPPACHGRKSPQLLNFYAQMHPEDMKKGALLYVLQKTGKIPEADPTLKHRHYIAGVRKESDGSYVCMVSVKMYCYAKESDRPKLNPHTGFLYQDNYSQCQEIDAAFKTVLSASEVAEAYPGFDWSK